VGSPPRTHRRGSVPISRALPSPPTLRRALRPPGPDQFHRRDTGFDAKKWRLNLLSPACCPATFRRSAY
jgi:hypothetical protein